MRQETMRLDPRLLSALVLVIIVAALLLATVTGHHTAVPHAATAIEYGL
jgi:hypothetical protein